MSAKVKPRGPAPIPTPDPTPQVVINVYVDNLKREDEAREIEKTIRNIAGSTGNVDISYSSPALTIKITYNDQPGSNQDISALSSALKDHGIHIDTVDTAQNSIKGWKERMWLW